MQDDSFGAADIPCTEEDGNIVCSANKARAKVVKVTGKVGDPRSSTLLCPDDLNVEQTVFENSRVDKFDDFFNVMTSPRQMDESLRNKGCKGLRFDVDQTEVSKDENVDTKQDVFDLGVKTPENEWNEAGL